MKTADLFQLHQRVKRAEISVMGSDLLSEPVVKDVPLNSFRITDLGIELLHDDGCGYRFIPLQRLVHIDYRMDDE